MDKPLYFCGTTVTSHDLTAHPARSFAELCEALKHPVKLTLSFDEYQSKTPEERAEIKRSLPYLVPSTYEGDHAQRGIKGTIWSNVVFLDVDDSQDARKLTSSHLMTMLHDFSFLAYPTISHTPEMPRMRVAVEASIPASRYSDAALTLGKLIGLREVNKESKICCQPMFPPTVFRDQDGGHTPPIMSLKGRAFVEADISGPSALNRGTMPPKDGQGDNSEEMDGLEYLRAPLPGWNAEEVEAMLRDIPASVQRDEWVDICAGIKHQFCNDQDTGFRLFNTWSATCPEKYDKQGKGDTRRVWDSFDAQPLDRYPATLKKVIKLANAYRMRRTDPASRFFYDGRGYFMEAGALYVPLPDVASVRRHLKAMRCGGEKDAMGLRPDEHVLNRIQEKQFVTYAGGLAGYPRGLHQLSGGKKVLVTESPQIPEPAPGEWKTLEKVFEGLVGDGDPAQLLTLYGWIKTALDSIRAGSYRPGQALALAGPAGCGKSLLIEILRRIFGGRCAGAYEWLSGRTDFNLACAAAELLVVDDKAGSSDPRARAALAANIKSSLFAGEVRIEGKHKNAFDCRPCWRLVFALNDEPECLLVLPPLNEDVRDKITLLRCHSFPLPMPAHTMEDREAFKGALVSEIPAFLHWLGGWEIPAALRDTRCGVKAYHHPALMNNLQSLSPEAQLWQYIQNAVGKGLLTRPAKFTAHELEHILTANSAPDCHAARSLLKWHAACGTHLGRLAKDYPEQIAKAGTVGGIQRWELRLPEWI